MDRTDNKSVTGKIVVATAIAVCAFSNPAIVHARQLEFGASIAPAARTGVRPSSRKIYTFSDEAGVRVSHINRMDGQTEVRLSVFEPTGERISAHVAPASAVLAPQATGRFIVVVPMRGQQSRRFVVCVTERHQAIKRRCGFYNAVKVN